MRILVVDDEKRLAAGLRTGLEAEGFAVNVALTGTDGLWLAREHPYDAIVLDILLPGINGYAIYQTLRAESVWTPILMLTAKDGEWDQVEGLDTGADGYLTKPFSYPVLVARIRALIRRGARDRPTVLEAGDLCLDPATRQAMRGDVEIELTAREVSVLEYFLRRRGEVVSKRDILDHVGTTTSRATQTSSRCTWATSAPSWTGRSVGMRSRRSEGRAIACWPTVADSGLNWPQRLRGIGGTVRVRTTVAAVAIVGVALLGASIALVAILGDSLTNSALEHAISRAEEVANALVDRSVQPGIVGTREDDEVVQVRTSRAALARPVARLTAEAAPARRAPVSGSSERKARCAAMDSPAIWSAGSLRQSSPRRARRI